jgi:hypothetical protein
LDDNNDDEDDNDDDAFGMTERLVEWSTLLEFATCNPRLLSFTEVELDSVFDFGTGDADAADDALEVLNDLNFPL